MKLAILVTAGLLLAVSPAFAVYNDVKVVSVEKVGPQDDVWVTADFSGPGETTVQRTNVFRWNYTDNTMAEWSGTIIEKLNTLKVLGTRVKKDDKLPITKPVIVPDVVEVKP